MLEPVRQRVLDGRLRYIGSSAGTNLACPTIRTTNDMRPVRDVSWLLEVGGGFDRAI